MKTLIHIILFMGMALASSATSYERLSARMNDHFDHAEWSEVLVETEQMIKLRPTDADPYSAAIIAAQFLEDIPTENRYLTISQSNRIHIDSLLQRIYVRTKLIHNAHVYEQLLLNLKENNKWLSRVFNIYLLDFYDFARKTEETIKIADELLLITPDNIRFKKIKANALFYQGNTQEAVDLYESIIASQPDDYDILTFLAAYYTTQTHQALDELDNEYLNNTTLHDADYMARKQEITDTQVAKSLDLLYKAQAIRTSEYIESEIEKLNLIKTLSPRHPNKDK